MEGIVEVGTAAPCDDAGARQQLPLIASALEHQLVGFNHLRLALLGKDDKDPALAEAYRCLLPLVLQAFQLRLGELVYIFLGPVTGSAVAIHRIRTRMLGFIPWQDTDMSAVSEVSEPPALRTLVHDLDRLIIECRRLLGTFQRRMALERVYAAYASVLRYSEDLHASRTGDAALSANTHRIRELEVIVDDTAEYIARAAIRKSQAWYLTGMVIGVILVVLVLAPPLNLLVSVIPSTPINASTMLGCIIAGGIAAVLSVMTRMTRNRLILDHEAGKTVTCVLGAFRPIVGGIFGGVIYLFLQSGIVALTVSAPSTTPGGRVLFYWCMGFIAGFSERWVPDILAGVEPHPWIEWEEPSAPRPARRRFIRPRRRTPRPGEGEVPIQRTPDGHRQP